MKKHSWVSKWGTSKDKVNFFVFFFFPFFSLDIHFFQNAFFKSINDDDDDDGDSYPLPAIYSVPNLCKALHRRRFLESWLTTQYDLFNFPIFKWGN